MIYSHKPQRSGRSIHANTNNPPQDPPAPPLKLVQMQKLESTIQQQKVQITKLLGYQKSYELLKSENSILELQYKSQHTQLETLTTEYDTLKVHSISEEAKYNSTIQELEEVNEKYLTEKHKVVTLTAQLHKITKEYDKTNEKTKTDKLEFEEKIKTQQAKLKEKLSAEKQQASIIDTQQDKLEEQLEKITQEYDTLKVQSTSDEEKYQSALAKLEGQLEKQSDEYDLFMIQYTSKKDIIDAKYHSTLKKLDTLNHKYTEEKQKAKQQVNALTSQIEKITKEYHIFKEKSETIQLELKSEIKDKQTRLDRQQIKVKQLTEEIASLQVPDVLIEDSTPPVLDAEPSIEPKKKLSWLQRFIGIFRRK